MKVKDELGTKYIINTIEGRFRELLENASKRGEVVDLAECKFGPICSAHLRNYYNKCTIINTADEELNNLLKSNTISASTTFERFNKFVFPTKVNFESYVDTLKGLKSGDKFTVPILSTMQQKAFITLLILMRPDIELDIDDCSMSIYEFVANEWKPAREEHTRYLQFLSPGLVTITKDPNGLFGNKTFGYLSESLYIDKYNVLPAEFGTEQLYKGGHPTGEWSRVVDKCLRILLVKKKKEKTLADFLEFREE